MIDKQLGFQYKPRIKRRGAKWAVGWQTSDSTAEVHEFGLWREAMDFVNDVYRRWYWFPILRVRGWYDPETQALKERA